MDQAFRTSNMLDLNLQVMGQLSEATLRYKNLNLPEQEATSDILIQALSDSTKEHSFLKNNVSSLISRTTILSNQVSLVHW